MKKLCLIVYIKIFTSVYILNYFITSLISFSVFQQKKNNNVNEPYWSRNEYTIIC